eukprot:m.78039 g.78039  ORF g.78039 m.78039 type:complete len:773 (+) comp25072_c0_seq1:205-2523(+)
MSSESRDCGGTGNVLPIERAKASFNVENMTNILDGGEAFTTKRRWIQSAHDRAFTDPKRIGAVVDHFDKPRMQVVAESMRHFMDVHWPHFERGYVPRDQDMSFMSGAKFGNTGPLSLHYGVFMSTLRSQTSAQQREWWLEAAMKLNFIGCYAQTELGHGSNVRGLQTTATFRPAPVGSNGDGEWILNTPTLQSTKWWSTGMYSATHAAVYAQMILENKPKGVHVFFVQLRGADLLPLPGIEMGDIGPKLGDNDTPIGYLRLNNVRIPRRHLMEKRQHVTAQGLYVIGEPTHARVVSLPTTSTTSPPVVRHPSDQMKVVPAPTKNVSHYITMLKTRIGLTNTAGSALAKACTIAARYSAVRRQGFAAGTRGEMNDAECQILDYQNQLFRILQWTSTAYAIKFVGRWLYQRRKLAEVSMKRGVNNDANDDLPEVHASAAGLKALCCCLAADGIEDLRRACGGHGYLISSGIASLEADFKGPNTTAEGDYVVLALQTARFLLKSIEAVRRGESLPGTMVIFAPLADPTFDPHLGDGRPTPPTSLVHTLTSRDEACCQTTRDYLTELFAYRSLVRTSRMCAAYDQTLQRTNNNQGQARAENARAMQTAALAHVRFFMLSKFFAEVENIEAGPERLAVHRLATFFALSEIANGGSGWAGIVTAVECDGADAAVDLLCTMLRPDAVSLVDAFDISDTVLNSALGKNDGNVYEAIYEAAATSVMNDGAVPECLDAVKQYLNINFLKNANDLAATGFNNTSNSHENAQAQTQALKQSSKL